ncbi:TcaA 3rd/4th domain-containing protein [Alkalibacillus salilacus]|uniref:Membrane protein YvbJ n=1 Tax=Alkalibacillus salilacus TaxID=284582 RepID=A0ABT9VHQ6_9BACI|nr:zinc-ribbon domain-containing protein [Alkalibacillus salilacus]MDQ0160495.1 putative membrane protein YvbJ [Alkalibacillus salilacus]
MFCKECGKQAKEGARFCANCGQPFALNQDQGGSEQVTYGEKNKVNQTNEEVTHYDNHSVEQEVTSENEYHNGETLDVDVSLGENHESSNETNEESLNASNTSGPQSQVEAKPQQSKPKTRKLKKSKGKVALWVSIPLFLVVLVVGAYFGGNYLYGDEAQIDQLEQAVTNGDADYLSERLVHNRSEAVPDGYVDQFASYFNNHPDQLDQLLNQLHKQMQGEDASNQLIYANESDRQFFVYPQYQFELSQVEIEAGANFDQTTIELVGHDQVTTSVQNETVEFDSLLPGQYTVQIYHDGVYGQFEDEFEIDFWEENVVNASVQAKFEGESVALDVDMDEATVLLNDEEVGVASELESVGPVKFDGTTTLQAVYEYPWGESQSEAVSVTEGMETVELSVDSSNQESVREDVFDRVVQHANEWIDAYHDRDISHFSVMESEEYLSNIANNFDSLRSDSLFYEGEVSDVRVDQGYFDIYEEDGTYQVDVLTELSFYAGFYPEGDKGELNKESSSYIWQYELYYDENEGDWFIQDSEEMDQFETDDVVGWY